MTARRNSILTIFTFLTLSLLGQVSQIDIPRIGMMPDEPSPFNVRDWDEVAVKYDSFVYDITRTGQYLPLVNLQASGVNYPQNPAFGLHTYVGTNSPNGKEAINILPSLVGATLAGTDKSNQFGQNWVLMSQDFFNKNNGELIYLNNVGGSSGNDWWYDMMPNIFFYQLYELYPDVGGDEDFQFISVADRFSQAVRAMGGSDTPWQPAYMNYRAWDFKQMQPNANGVKEPEAAGAFAWVLYNAWKQAGNPEYLRAAEWSMEFLNDWPDNPSYELQLPYGVYTAAKMNAEIGTDYNIEKMVNWTFDRGNLRGWGAIVGKWGGFDVHGLIGEANDNGNDYAFQMNGAQQAAALAPMVRYDKRFARAIGKWMLNLANATRLFYPGFLPGFLQDASDWSDANDPERVVGYEALREVWQGNSPYSTGDAVNGGWAATNLALYGTSSIGYLGAILKKTDDPKILQTDLLKTDFYNGEAYPTYLLYNPYGMVKTVSIAVGDDPVDIYEALSETFISQNVSGTAALDIPANEAIVITLAPAGGTVSYDRNKMLIDGVVVDFMQTAEPFTHAPRIQALATEQTEVEMNTSVPVYGKAFDKDSDNLTYTWSASSGNISGTGTTVQFEAPASQGSATITLIVTDDTGNQDTATLELDIVAEINDAPQILSIEKSEPYVGPAGSVSLTANVFDSNNDPLTYTWSASGGSLSGSGSTVNWTAPAAEGIYQITLDVQDDEGLSASATTTMLVKNFPASGGNLVAWYPFSGNGNDISGNNLHGQIFGALLVPDFLGNAASAILTDGLNDRMTVTNDPLLNFQEAITVSVWVKPTQLFDKEMFILSHGSWQNRLKISITPDKKIRWTVNTLQSIGDLDSELTVQQDSIYHITASYGDGWMLLYIDGELHSYRTLNGNIRTTTQPFLVAQMLPDQTEYNYKGLLDEVKIFDYALTPPAVRELFENSLTAVNPGRAQVEKMLVSPNPGQDEIRVRVPEAPGELSVFDANGRLVTTRKTNGDSSLSLDVAAWQQGVYALIFKNEMTMAVARFIKM